MRCFRCENTLDGQMLTRDSREGRRARCLCEQWVLGRGVSKGARGGGRGSEQGMVERGASKGCWRGELARDGGEGSEQGVLGREGARQPRRLREM